MRAKAWQDEIVNLWPTLVGQVMLPGCATANRELADLAGDTSGRDNLFEIGTEATTWLHQHVTSAVASWFRRSGADAPPGWRLTGRLRALGFGGYRELGNEPGAYLAGVYFINEPNAPELDHIRKDAAPSRITLYDPRVAFNAISLEQDPYFQESMTIEPRTGLLMLWPGYLRYFTRVHLSHHPWALAFLRVEVPPLSRAGSP